MHRSSQVHHNIAVLNGLANRLFIAHFEWKEQQLAKFAADFEIFDKVRIASIRNDDLRAILG
jgi:hypothetical protein